MATKKFNESAEKYAVPHTMSGGSVSNQVPTQTGAQFLDTLNVSVGGVSKGNYEPTETSGIKIRGTGAATKGTMARGPMG